MPEPTVSVVIPTYNRPDLLSRAIQSVINQTYEDFECIIVDDGSTKDTKKVVDEYDDDRLFYIEHTTNKGAAAARNSGIEKAVGEYIAFLDDDDEWDSEKLEKQVAMMEKQPSDVALVYCWMDYYEYPDNLYRRYQPTLEGYIFPQMLDGQRIGASSTLLVRRNVVEEIDGFDEDLSRGDDGDFIRRICRNYKVTCVHESLVNYYTDHGSPRLTNSQVEEHIEDHKVKLEKFESELQKYPNRAANIYADLGYHHSLIGDWNSSANCYLKAIKMAPNSTKIYKWLFRTIVSIFRREKH